SRRPYRQRADDAVFGEVHFQAGSSVVEMDAHDGGVLRWEENPGSSFPLCEVGQRFSSAAATAADFCRVPLSGAVPNFILITDLESRTAPAERPASGKREADPCRSIKVCGGRTSSPARGTC